MKRNALLVLMFAFPILSLSFTLMKPVAGEVPSSSSLFIEGDLRIPPYYNHTDFTNKVVTVNGSIIVESKGILFLKNATINLVKSGSNINFSDSSSLIAIDSYITGRYFNITFEGAKPVTVSKTSVECGTTWIKKISGDLVQIEGGINVKGSSEAVFTSIFLKGFLRTYDSSSLTITDSFVGASVKDISAYDVSTVSISSSIINPERAVRTFDSSRLIVVNSQKGVWRMEAHDSSSVVILNTELERLTTYDSSLASLKGAIITDGLLVYGYSKAFVFDSTLSKGVELTAYLSSYGSSMISVSGTNLKGILSLHDSSTISVEDSIIEWANIRGSSTASFSKATISTMYAYDHSDASLIGNSTVTFLRAYDSSSVSISDARVTMLSATHSSTVSLVNSKVQELRTTYKSINGSFLDMRTGNVKTWSSQANTNIFVDSDGYAPSISLEGTSIEAWSLYFLTSQNVTITNSTLKSLTISATTAYLIGSSVSSYDFSDEAKAYLYWYLSVQATSSASVKVYDSSMTLVESKTADSKGQATFILLEKIMDATNTPPSAVYTIDVSSPSFSGRQKVEMTDNKQIVLTPPPSFLQQYWYIIVMALVAATVVVVILFRLRRGRSLKETV